MTASLVRPAVPLTWLRLRLRVTGRSAGQVVARGHTLAELLPRVPVDGTPLHRKLGVLGALLSVEADGHGVVARAVADPDRLPVVVGALRSALRSPLTTDLVRAARQRCAVRWRWAHDDSETLADLIADLALHTPQSSWSGIYDDLVTAMAEETSQTDDSAGWSLSDAVGAVSVAHVGPRDESELLATVSRGRACSSAVDSTDLIPGSARWRLDVVSDGSALVRLGWRAPRRDAPDFTALSIAARVIGGHHRSRLTREFRTKYGWSYSPWALLRAGRDHGLWQVSVRVPAEHVVKTADRVRELVSAYQQNDAEHAAAIAHASTEICRLWSSGDSALSLLGYWQDLGLDVFVEKDRWSSTLTTTKPADVATALRTWLATDPHLEVILA